jgi:hypothetical protein
MIKRLYAGKSQRSLGRQSTLADRARDCGGGCSVQDDGPPPWFAEHQKSVDERFRAMHDEIVEFANRFGALANTDRRSGPKASDEPLEPPEGEEEKPFGLGADAEGLNRAHDRAFHPEQGREQPRRRPGFGRHRPIRSLADINFLHGSMRDKWWS